MLNSVDSHPGAAPQLKALLASQEQLTWVELEAASLGVDRASARKFLDRKLDDPDQIELYTMVFRNHPELREILRPGEWAEEPAPWADAIPSLMASLHTDRSRLRGLTVVSSGRWDGTPTNEMSHPIWVERTQDFGRNAANQLFGLLTQATCVGVTWGESVKGVIDELWDRSVDGCPEDRRPIVCLPTVGDYANDAFILELSRASTSTWLAWMLCKALNGEEAWKRQGTQKVLYSLLGMWAFYPMLCPLGSVREGKRCDAHRDDYRAIFGDRDLGGDDPGLIRRKMDALVTSLGNASQQHKHWTVELEKAGIPSTKLEQLVIGDIGGVFIARKNLCEADRRLLQDIQARWSGLTLQDIESCAARSPGVVVLAMGRNKANIVRHCVAMGLINVLIVDEDCAAELMRHDHS